MIFLSPQKVSMLLELLDKNQNQKAFKMLAQSENEKCIPMGEGCFHPQYGYMEKAPIEKPNVKNAPLPVASDPDLKLKTFNAVETNMINCDKNNYFDIYCGKEKAKGRNAEIEIWFDVSSSLRNVDYNKDPDYCARRTFLTKVMEGCKDKVRASIYNTSLKEIGETSSACLSYGTNDESKLIQWMKGSEAKKLLIVTDVDEMSSAMKEFLDERGAKLIGDGVKPFSANDLVDYARDFSKSCK